MLQNLPHTPSQLVPCFQENCYSDLNHHRLVLVLSFLKMNSHHMNSFVSRFFCSTLSLEDSCCVCRCFMTSRTSPLSMGFLRQGYWTGVGCHVLLQGIFPTQRSNPGLPYCRWILYCLSQQGSHTHAVCSSLLFSITV